MSQFHEPMGCLGTTMARQLRFRPSPFGWDDCQSVTGRYLHAQLSLCMGIDDLPQGTALLLVVFVRFTFLNWMFKSVFAVPR